MGYEHELEENNWRFMQISKVNDDIIQLLAQNIKLQLSDDFFLSLESLLKLGKKAVPFLKSLKKDVSIENYKRKLISIALRYIKRKSLEDLVVLQLYHPDFEIRAKTIVQMSKLKEVNYLNVVTPLLKDPDDSVRWAAINYLIDNHFNNKNVKAELIAHAKVEKNPIIKRKLEENLNIFN